MIWSMDRAAELMQTYKVRQMEVMQAFLLRKWDSNCDIGVGFLNTPSYHFVLYLFIFIHLYMNIHLLIRIWTNEVCDCVYYYISLLETIQNYTCGRSISNYMYSYFLKHLKLSNKYALLEKGTSAWFACPCNHTFPCFTLENTAHAKLHIYRNDSSSYDVKGDNQNISDSRILPSFPLTILH